MCYLHRRSRTCREQARRKLAAYERHIRLGLIAQGLLQVSLAVSKPVEVWQPCGSRLRAMKTGATPSDVVVASAWRHSLGRALEFASHALLEEIPRQQISPEIQALISNSVHAP